MKKVKLYLWDQCDLYAGFAPRRFRACAYVLHLMGCDYWFTSIDYQGGKA